MKVLFLAPQPFFQERGTPIAIKLALETMSDLFAVQGLEIELLVYNEGTDIEIPNVTIKRIWSPKWLRGVGPGISIKKLFCDLIFTYETFRIILSRKSKINLIHAVEESVFIALFTKLIFGIPYIYDMDSSLSLQLTDKWLLLKPLLPIFEWLEKIAIRNGAAVAPVCDSLELIASKFGSKKTVLLRDVSLIETNKQTKISLKEELNLPHEAVMALYIGNLEPYQGIDLLIDSFSLITDSNPNLHVVIIGGTTSHIELYKQKLVSRSLDRIHIIGAKPLADLGQYLRASDILLSPRIKGNNTPMKIYSYLHAGKSILATNLPTHSQVLNNSVSVLTDPTPLEFSKGLELLARDPSLRENLGQSAFDLAEKNFTIASFKKQMADLYGEILKKSSDQTEPTKIGNSINGIN